MSEPAPIATPLPALQTAIHTLRGQKVILDSDLARVYGVECNMDSDLPAEHFFNLFYLHFGGTR